MSRSILNGVFVFRKVVGGGAYLTRAKDLGLI